MKDDILLGDTPKALKRRRRQAGLSAAGRLWKHSSLAEIDGLVSRQQIQSYFTFAMVRNPWDRMVSYYHWLRRQRFDHPALVLAHSLGFSEFLNHAETSAGMRDWPSQAYMRNTDGQVSCDAFLRLEHFEQDAVPLFAHLGFSLTLGRENTSQRLPDYRSYYSAADVDLVARCCADDITRFGYQFDR